MTKRARIVIGALTVTLLLALGLPGFCSCSLCSVEGTRPTPCECTVLGVYLGRKAMSLLHVEMRMAPQDNPVKAAEAVCTGHR
jgi:hypothetical protein